MTSPARADGPSSRPRHPCVGPSPAVLQLPGLPVCCREVRTYHTDPTGHQMSLRLLALDRVVSVKQYQVYHNLQAVDDNKTCASFGGRLPGSAYSPATPRCRVLLYVSHEVGHLRCEAETGASMPAATTAAGPGGGAPGLVGCCKAQGYQVQVSRYTRRPDTRPQVCTSHQGCAAHDWAGVFVRTSP